MYYIYYSLYSVFDFHAILQLYISPLRFRLRFRAADLFIIAFFFIFYSRTKGSKSIRVEAL